MTIPWPSLEQGYLAGAVVHSRGHSFTTLTGHLRSHHHYITISSADGEGTVIAIARSLRLVQ